MHKCHAFIEAVCITLFFNSDLRGPEAMPMTVSKIVDKQIKEWDRISDIVESENKKETIYPLITISREFGAMGAALAEKLGETTGFKVWDKELLGAIAEDLGSDQKLLETLDERRRQDVEDTASAFIGEIHTNVNYIRSLIRVIKTTEEHGRSIIVGRGGNYIIENEDMLSVRLVRPFKSRVARIAEKHQLSRSDAKSLVEKKDAEREEFIKRYFYKDVNNASDYDLILNTDTFTLEQAESLILEAYEMKTGLSLPPHIR